MKNLVLSTLAIFSFLILSSQSWTLYDVSALGQTNRIDDYHLDTTNQKIYMVSSFGFCIYDLSLNQYDTCFLGPNSRFRANTNKLIYANNRYWIVTVQGISSYDGNSFVHYTTANGLIDNDIEDIAVDNFGQLWLATLNGVSHFNGNTFIHDSNKVARAIAIDDSNRVFIFPRTPILIGGPVAFEQIEVKTGNTWTTHNITGLAAFNAGGGGITYSDIYTSNGEIIIKASSLRGAYHRLTYPAHIDTVNFEIKDVPQSSISINDLQTDMNGKKWLLTNPTAFNLFSTLDSVFYPQNIRLNRPNGGIYGNPRIKIYGSKILTYINGDFYLGDISSKPLKKYQESIDINSIKTGVTVLGGLFNDNINFTSNFEVPKGSNFHAIYAANLMVSSKKSGDTAFKMNQTNQFAENFNAGPIGNLNGTPGEWIIKLNQQQIQNHINNYNSPNYTMIDEIASWPGNGDTSIGFASQLAPFADLNQNGIYEPMQGDYPKIKGDEAIFWINNIDDFEYHGMLYGFDAPNDSALNQTLFLQYQIYNRSNVVYDSVKLGLFVDFDLGNSADDYMGCDSINNMFFIYNGDNFDESVRGLSGAGANIPFVGVKFLSDSMDGYIQYNIGNGSNGDPVSELHWHRYLNSRWKSGAPVTYGGDGFQTSSNIPTKYMYTNPGNIWSEDNPGFGLAQSAPGDRRGLGHIPYFSLQPGASKNFEVAIGYALEPNGGRLGSKDKLITFLDSSAKFWDNNILIGIDEKLKETQLAEFQLYPNPAKDQLVIQSESKGELVQFFTMTGRLVKTERITQNRQVLDISELISGLYFIRIGNALQKLVVN